MLDYILRSSSTSSFESSFESCFTRSLAAFFRNAFIIRLTCNIILDKNWDFFWIYCGIKTISLCSKCLVVLNVQMNFMSFSVYIFTRYMFGTYFKVFIYWTSPPNGNIRILNVNIGATLNSARGPCKLVKTILRARHFIRCKDVFHVKWFSFVACRRFIGFDKNLFL